MTTATQPVACADAVIRKLCTIAETSIADIVSLSADESGRMRLTLRPLKMLTPEQWAAIEHLSFTARGSGGRAVTFGTDYLSITRNCCAVRGAESATYSVRMRDPVEAERLIAELRGWIRRGAGRPSNTRRHFEAVAVALAHKELRQRAAACLMPRAEPGKLLQFCAQPPRRANLRRRQTREAA